MTCIHFKGVSYKSQPANRHPFVIVPCVNVVVVGMMVRIWPMGQITEVTDSMVVYLIRIQRTPFPGYMFTTMLNTNQCA